MNKHYQEKLLEEFCLKYPENEFCIFLKNNAIMIKDTQNEVLPDSLNSKDGIKNESEPFYVKFKHLLLHDGNKPLPESEIIQMTEKNIKAWLEFYPKIDELFEKLRSVLKEELIINSSYRCKKRNQNVKSNDNSAHLIDAAIDIQDSKDRKIEKYLIKNSQLLVKHNIRCILEYPTKNIVHLQNRYLSDPKKVIFSIKQNKFIV